METICKIREIYRAISEFETTFHQEHNLCLNEGMLLCGLSKEERLSSGEIAEMLGLTTSNASKVIKSVEMKGYIVRGLGQTDKRQMYFTLTSEGEVQLTKLKCTTIKIPEMLQTILRG